MRYSLFLLFLLISSSFLTKNCLSGACCSTHKGSQDEKTSRKHLLKKTFPAASATDTKYEPSYQQQGGVTPASRASNSQDDSFVDVDLEGEKAVVKKQRARIAGLQQLAQEAEERERLEHERAKLNEEERQAKQRLASATQKEMERRQIVLYDDIRTPGALLSIRPKWEIVKNEQSGDSVITLLPKLGEIFIFKDVNKAKLDTRNNPLATFVLKYHNNLNCTPPTWNDVEPNLQKIFKIIKKHAEDEDASSVKSNICNILNFARATSPNDVSVALEASEKKGWARILIMVDPLQGVLISIPKISK